MSNLHDLALIGNCSVAALVNGMGEFVWARLPRFDSDALFCSLLKERSGTNDYGFTGVDLLDFLHAEQHYVNNTAILTTRLFDQHNSSIEITDFAPAPNDLAGYFARRC